MNVSERFKARTLIVIVCILLVLSAVSMALVIAVDNTLPQRRLITILLIALQPFAFVLMWFSRSTKEAAWFTVVLLLLTVFYIDYNNQSFKGAFSIIWMLPSTLSVMLLGGKPGLNVALASIVGMSLNFFLLKVGVLPEAITPPEKWLHAEFVISISIMVIVTFCVFGLYTMARQRELELTFEIEARKRFARELEAEKDISEKALANKSMFLATMSHELRTPLNSILGNAELLAKSKQLTSTDELRIQEESRINDIFVSSQLLKSIINDVLDISKLDTYGIELHKENYDISEQLKQLHRMMLPKVKPDVEFTVVGIDTSVEIYADQNRLAQVVLNLMSNALKFTESGQVLVELKYENNQFFELIFKDTGVGISSEDAKHLFEDFVQVRKHANRQVEGTGLGLAIVKRIVDKMNGTIELDSAEGQGSTFSIKLPIEVTPPNSDNKSSEEKKLMTQDLSTKRLLIVDDVAMNCIILKALLESVGVQQIEEDNDGSQAVERVKQDQGFDAILMDVRMPKMDGLEASQLIREMGYEKPIIAVTANAFEEDRKTCLEAGMSNFLSKPIDMEKLKAVLNEVFA